MALCLAPVCDAVPALDADGKSGVPGIVEIDAAALRSSCRRLVDVVEAWGLQRCHAWAPLIDGKQVCCTHAPCYCLNSQSLCERARQIAVRMVFLVEVVRAPIHCALCRLLRCLALTSPGHWWAS
jgi:hypothetical protein